MAVNLVNIIVLLGACAAVIAILRKPQRLKWVAVPFAILVLLGAIGIVIALLAPRHRIVPAQEVSTYDPVFETFNANAKDGRIMWNQTVQPPSATWAKLALLSGVALVPMIGFVLFASRKWIARNAGVLVPIAGVAMAGLLLAGVFVGGSMAWNDHMTTREAAVRSQRAAELRAIGEAQRQRFFEETTRYVNATATQESVEATPVEVPTAVAEAATTEPAPAGENADDAATDSAIAAAVPELPEWARGETVDLKKLHEAVHQNPVVLKSDEWSSKEEAEVQLNAMAARAVQQQLRSQKGIDWLPSKDFLQRSGAILQRHVEQTSLKVGAFETPMYRTYWQVSATPHVCSLAETEWKSTEVKARLAMLGAGVAALTLLFAGGAAGLRLDSATSGRYRRHMFAAAGFVTTMGAALALLS